MEGRGGRCPRCSARLEPGEWARHQRRLHGPPLAPRPPPRHCPLCPFAAADVRAAVGHALLEGHRLPTPLLPSKREGAARLNSRGNTFQNHHHGQQPEADLAISESFEVEETSEASEIGRDGTRNVSPAGPSAPEATCKDAEALTDGLPQPAENDASVALKEDNETSPKKFKESLSYANGQPEVESTSMEIEAKRITKKVPEARSTIACRKCGSEVLKAPGGILSAAKKHVLHCFNIQKFACSSCSFKASERSMLEEHIERKCLGSRLEEVKRERCDQVATQGLAICFPHISEPENQAEEPEAELSTEDSEAREKRNSIECKKCGSTLRTFRGVLKVAKDHVLHCCKIRRYECSACSYRTSLKNELKTHMKKKCFDASIKMVDEEKCDLAEKEGLKSCFPNIKYNEKSFSKKGNTLQCANCHSTGRYSEPSPIVAAKVHVRFCLKLSPFACSQCEYRSAVKQNVLRHIHAQKSVCKGAKTVLVDKEWNEAAEQEGLRRCFPNLCHSAVKTH